MQAHAAIELTSPLDPGVDLNDPDLLDEIEAYLEKDLDVIDGENKPVPNKAMALLMRLREARQAV